MEKISEKTAPTNNRDTSKNKAKQEKLAKALRQNLLRRKQSLAKEKPDSGN